LIAFTDSFRCSLHVDDVRADLVSGFCSLARQSFHLLRDYRESAAGVTGARGLDRCVERQQVALLRDGGDELHDVADPVAGRRKFRHPRVRCLGLLDRVGSNAV
jgi:hypothetical protein